MLHIYNEGDKVKVWPAPGHEAQLEPPAVVETPAGFQFRPGRLIPKEGAEVAWTPWLQEMARSGAVLFSDPGEGGCKVTQAKRVRHPHERCQFTGKPAYELGASCEDELAHWGALGFKGGKLAAKKEAK